MQLHKNYGGHGTEHLNKTQKMHNISQITFVFRNMTFIKLIMDKVICGQICKDATNSHTFYKYYVQLRKQDFLISCYF